MTNMMIAAKQNHEPADLQKSKDVLVILGDELHNMTQTHLFCFGPFVAFFSVPRVKNHKLR